MKHDLSVLTVGILGMAFKGDNDDIRESLAFKLRKLLAFEAKEVICTDEYAKVPWFRSLEEVLELPRIFLDHRSPALTLQVPLAQATVRGPLESAGARRPGDGVIR